VSTGVNSAGLVIYAGASTPSAVPPDFIDAVQRVVVRQHHDRASTFQVVLNADRLTGSATELPVIAAATVTPGTRMQIAIRLGSTQCGIMDGVVAFQELTSAGRGGGLTYSVIGEDLSLYMRLKEKTTEWPGRSCAQIAREILGNYSQYGLTASVVAPQQDVTPPANGWVPQQNATDLRYLRALARAFGHIVAIRPSRTLGGQSVAYWGPPSREGTALPPLTLDTAAAGNLVSIEFGYDAAAAEVFAGGSRADDDTETALAIQPTFAFGLTALSKDSGTSPTLLRTRAFIEPSMAGTLATSYAAARVQDSARSMLRAKAVVDGLVYGTVVTPASIVAVAGAGDAHNGLYYVERVEHKIERNAYRQEIEMTREGLGTTISRAAS
jgi:phage protein D